MNRILTIQLEWKYPPVNYLEEPISFSFETGDLDIKNGVAIANIDPDLYHADSSIQEVLTRKIESRLHAVQVMTHRDFELSGPSRTDIREDGKKNHFLEVESCIHAVSLGTIDLIVKDKDGDVVSDTKKSA
ncbi:hypothetical protein [Nitrosomonas aestuarii]|uniref:hypothetical protein n=1 Tax=Nitrosomonas aestuarii TaxID=52441 RepID=UPI000D314949|nr:hypothetical protein [Nitrosomonas aestuarii]PTN13313.1 hypothetical protein C8R11_101306 [Nitrosomonas aestuarii]